MERYELVKDIGSGNFGLARLMVDKKTKDYVVLRYIERGEKIDENVQVQRAIINHRSLKHPNIVRFKEVLLTPKHLAIAMEYAAGGELLDRICSAGRFIEDEARYFFQQLISGVSYCHSMPSIGTPAYVAPEVWSKKENDGKSADVWSCGVTLYVMLVGALPFEDPEDLRNVRKTIARIMNVQYMVPDNVHISPECRDLLSRIFVALPSSRISIPEIRRHDWFLKNLPADLSYSEESSYDHEDVLHPPQSIEEINQIIAEARIVTEEDIDTEDDLDYYSSDEFVY